MNLGRSRWRPGRTGSGNLGKFRSEVCRRKSEEAEVGRKVRSGSSSCRPKATSTTSRVAHVPGPNIEVKTKFRPVPAGWSQTAPKLHESSKMATESQQTSHDQVSTCNYGVRRGDRAVRHVQVVCDLDHRRTLFGFYLSTLAQKVRTLGLTF